MMLTTALYLDLETTNSRYLEDTVMDVLSPPILRSSKRRRFRNLLRVSSGRRKKYVVKGPRKLRKAWRRNTQYYYPKSKKLKKKHRKAAFANKSNFITTVEQSTTVMSRLRKWILREFINSRPSPALSRRSPWSFIIRSGSRGLFGVFRAAIIELSSLAGIPGVSERSIITSKLDNASKFLKRMDRMLRKMHLMRLFPWKRRPQRKFNLALEW